MVSKQERELLKFHNYVSQKMFPDSIELKVLMQILLKENFPQFTDLVIHKFNNLCMRQHPIQQIEMISKEIKGKDSYRPN